MVNTKQGGDKHRYQDHEHWRPLSIDMPSYHIRSGSLLKPTAPWAPGGGAIGGDDGAQETFTITLRKTPC